MQLVVNLMQFCVITIWSPRTHDNIRGRIGSVAFDEFQELEMDFIKLIHVKLKGKEEHNRNRNHLHI